MINYNCRNKNNIKKPKTEKEIEKLRDKYNDERELMKSINDLSEIIMKAHVAQWN